MSAPETPRLLFVHAHPDDECLTTGGTIARYAAHGAEVHVVTCTLGEEGEVIGESYQLLAVEHADQLGGYRIHELTRALNALGVKEPIFLGGPGRWRDSGMEGTPPRQRTRFIDAGEVAVDEMARLIDQLRPHVVVTYDPDGGYGHPDHIHAHDVATAAVGVSTWKVPKVYWTVVATAAMRAGLGSLTEVPTAGSDPIPTPFRSVTPTTRSMPSSTSPTTSPRKPTRWSPTPRRSSSHPTGAPARCPTTWPYPSWRRSTTSSPRATPAHAMHAAGKRTCLRG